MLALTSSVYYRYLYSFFQRSALHQDLHSFPTRRSSDLNRFYGDMPEPPSPNRMASSHATLCSNFSTRWTIPVFVNKDVRFFMLRQPSYLMTWQQPFPG